MQRRGGPIRCPAIYHRADKQQPPGVSILLVLAEKSSDPEGWDGYISEASGRNNFRMPDYHRMDISANFHRSFKRCSRTINVSVYNLYNRKNPYMIYESHEYRYQNYNGALVQLSIFPILPSVAYTLKF